MKDKVAIIGVGCTKFGDLFEQSYEDMVVDMAGNMRRMLDFIGESFDERCVAFQDNRRLAHTPSYAQVSEKIYLRSRFRYRRTNPSTMSSRSIARTVPAMRRSSKGRNPTSGINSSEASSSFEP